MFRFLNFLTEHLIKLVFFFKSPKYFYGGENNYRKIYHGLDPYAIEYSKKCYKIKIIIKGL